DPAGHHSRTLGYGGREHAGHAQCAGPWPGRGLSGASRGLCLPLRPPAYPPRARVALRPLRERVRPPAGPRGLRVIRIARPAIGDEERAAVLAVLESGQLAQGAVTRELEETFARDVSHSKYAVAVSNGTAALHLALLAAGVGPGDEVITTPFTFQATANMILAVGAKPVFVDIGDDGNINPSLIEGAMTSQTKAVLPVHLYGRMCDMHQIEEPI